MQARGQEFDPPQLHQNFTTSKILGALKRASRGDKRIISAHLRNSNPRKVPSSERSATWQLFKSEHKFVSDLVSDSMFFDNFRF